jgi:hypothetical protein
VGGMIPSSVRCSITCSCMSFAMMRSSCVASMSGTFRSRRAVRSWRTTSDRISPSVIAVLAARAVVGVVGVDAVLVRRSRSSGWREAARKVAPPPRRDGADAAASSWTYRSRASS